MRRLLPLILFLALAPFAGAQDAAEKPMLILDAGGHTARVTNVLFSKDGRELITVSDDKSIRTWDVISGEPLRALRPPIGRGHEGMLFDAALSADGHTLAVGGYGFSDGPASNPIYLIDLTSSQIIRTFTGHSDVIHSLAFSNDGKRLASGSSDKSARVWDVATGKSEGVFVGHASRITEVAFSPDGRQLATASYDKTGRIWSVETGRMEAELKGHTKEVYCIAWRPDGRVIATGSWDKTIRLWSPEGKAFRGIKRLENQVTSLAFMSDSQTLLATWGGDIEEKFGAALFEAATGKERIRFTHHYNTVMCGAMSPDGSLAATSGGHDNETYLWKTTDGSVVHRLAGKGQTSWASGWDADGTTIAFGNTIRFRSMNERGPIERSFNIEELDIGTASGNPFVRAHDQRGSRSLKFVNDSTLTVKQNGASVAMIKLLNPYDIIRGFTLLADDRVAVGANQGVYLYNARSGEPIREFQGHTGVVWVVAPSPDDRFFLSGSDDQTVRIWDPNRDEPLLSFFAAGNDWVAWTPEGYYAASPGGESLMGWHVNNGRDRMATFYPADKFRKTLYRPDVIKLLLKTGSTELALKEADTARGRMTEATEVAKVLPPIVEVASPRTGSKFQNAAIEVRAIARNRGTQPITSLRLLLDGRPYRGQAGVNTIANPKPGEVRETWIAELEPGTHMLAVQADTSASQATSEPIEVTFEGAEPVQLPALYVLAVGVTEYPGDLRLHYAADDARAIERAFKGKSKSLFRAIDVKLLTDARATRKDFLGGLTWLRKQMTQRDIGVVFFSGHGQRDTEGSLFLLPVDADPDDPLATAVAGDQIKKALAGMPGRVLAILDACHAGAVDGDKRKGLLGALTDDLVRDLVTDDYGVIVMASSTGREFSLENDAKRQGNFTLAIVEGLSGEADYNKDGAVYLNELDTYVTDRVKALTNGRQHPVTARPASIRSFPLARP